MPKTPEHSRLLQVLILVQFAFAAPRVWWTAGAFWCTYAKTFLQSLLPEGVRAAVFSRRPSAGAD